MQDWCNLLDCACDDIENNCCYDKELYGCESSEWQEERSEHDEQK